MECARWNQRYSLRSEVIRKEMLEQIPVLAFGDRKYPPLVGDITPDEHVIFQLRVPLNSLHGGLVGRDDLTARVTLMDNDTGWQIVQDSERVSVADWTRWYTRGMFPAIGFVQRARGPHDCGISQALLTPGAVVR